MCVCVCVFVLCYEILFFLGLFPLIEMAHSLTHYHVYLTE